MVLNDIGIMEQFNFDEKLVNPASVDLTLSDTILVPAFNQLVDPSEEQMYIEKYTDFVIGRGEFVLGSTREVIRLPSNMAGQVHGKSSLGRLGLAVHVTAGWVDPGFNGVLTLEIVNHSAQAILLRADMRIAQIVFHMLTGDVEKMYQGRYQGDMDTTGSRYWL